MFPRNALAPIVLSICWTVALAGLARGAEPTWPQGTHWQLPLLEQRESVRMQGLATHTTTSVHPSEVGFGLSAVELQLDGLPESSGSWSRKSPASRKLELQPADLDAWLIHARLRVTELATQQGLDITHVALEWSKSRWTGKLGLKAGKTQARLVLRGRLKAVGQISVAGGETRACAFSVRLRGTSATQPAGLLQVGPGTSAQLPTAAFLLGATSGPAPFNVQCLDTSSGAVTQLSWDFGDGSTAGPGIPDPTHVYDTPGEYTITLTVSGPLGEHSAERVVSVSGNGPVSPEGFRLYPGILINDPANPLDDKQVMLPAKGPHQNWFVGLLSILSTKFSFVYPQASDSSTDWELLVAMRSTIVNGQYVSQKVKIRLDVKRANGGNETLLGPFHMTVQGPEGANTFHYKTSSGPVLDAQPGDRLKLIIDNKSGYDPSGTYAVEIMLPGCELRVPGY